MSEDLRKMAEDGGIETAMKEIAPHLQELQDLLRVSTIEKQIPEDLKNPEFKTIMLAHLAKLEDSINAAAQPNGTDVHLSEIQRNEMMAFLAGIASDLEQGSFNQGKIFKKLVDLNNLYLNYGFREETGA